jgi:hypothetical protein
MATPSQRFFSPTHTLSGSGIPVPRPVTTYQTNPLNTTYTTRGNFPTNSHLDSRETEPRELPLGAYRYIETAGAVTYRPVNLPGGKTRPPQREPLPDVKMEMGANGLYVPHEARQQHPNFQTTSNTFGAEKPQRFVTEEYRYYPRAHTFTNQFTGGNYRSYGLTTAKDEVRVHRVEFFSNP